MKKTKNSYVYFVFNRGFFRAGNFETCGIFEKTRNFVSKDDFSEKS